LEPAMADKVVALTLLMACLVNVACLCARL
jgi:hypothetical protein